MKDRLTPLERFSLLVIDEPQDRVPVFPLITSHAARVLGVSVREYVTDGATMARAQLVAQDRYGHDFVSLFSEVGLIAEALGSEFDFPQDDLPVLRRPKWNEPSEVDDRVVDPARDGRLNVYLDAIHYAYEARGDRVPVLAYIPAPFTTCQHLVPTEEFLLALLTRPDKTHELLRYATRSVIAFSRAVINQGGLPILVDPLASGSVISPEQYREFALPYEQEVIRFWHRYDLDVILHICGDMSWTPCQDREGFAESPSPLPPPQGGGKEREEVSDQLHPRTPAPLSHSDRGMLELMTESGADLVSVDRVDLADALRKVGGKVRVVGNFGTSDIWLGSAAEIETAVEAMVKASRSCPKGYVASTGCEVPVETPPENVDAFIRAAREAGLNPSFGLVSDKTHA